MNFTIRKRKNKMNVNSEQIQFDASVVVAQDQPLTPNGIFEALRHWLGQKMYRKKSYLTKVL